MKFIESAEDVDEIIIGLGSAQYSRFNKNFEAPLITNPFTVEERKEFIDASLKVHLKKPYSFHGILDQHDYNRWAAYAAHVVPEFRYIYNNSRLVAETYSAAGYEVRQFPTDINIHSTLLREHIANAGDWEKYVPEETAAMIKEKNLDQVIADLYRENPGEVRLIREGHLRKGMMTYEDFLKADQDGKTGLYDLEG